MEQITMSFTGKTCIKCGLPVYTGKGKYYCKEGCPEDDRTKTKEILKGN